MTDRYQKIRQAMEMGPTPGPWRFARTNSGMFVKSERLAGYFVEVRHCRTAQNVDADAHLIASCDPDTIRELLAERDELEVENRRLAEVLSKILENEASDWKAAEEFGGYVLDDELREARAVDEAMVKRFLIAFQNTPGDEAIAADEKTVRRWLAAAIAT